MIVCECLLYNFYFGTNYNPYEYIEFLKEHKLYNNDLYGRLKKYNIEYQFQGKNNFDLMNNDYFLNKNNIALCYVKNGKGHMIIVSGKNKDGLFFINDPSSSSPLTPFVAHTLDEIKEYASGNFHLIKLTKK
ncbi:MAG: hypothetical protein Q4F88_05585 [Eubacteriales bacterium]|nr:hypothetical protein [Eubacteriales bacterium]